jgi:serine protease Do
MTVRFPKPRIAFFAAAAFVAGVVFASGMNWIPTAAAHGGVGGRRTLHLPAPAAVSSADVPADFSSVAARVTPAVVSIRAEHDARSTAAPRQGQRQGRAPQLPPEFQQFFNNPGMQFNMPDPQQQDRTAGGSGFIVTNDGYVLTNNHVVDGADRVTVGLPDRRSFPAKIIGRDPQTDIAVLKINGTDLPTVPLGDDSKVRVGEWALAIGNPLQLDFTVTAGIISAKGRSNQLRDLNTNKYAIQDFIQTDAAINPGNSGGPLVNVRGEVIGINSAIASQTGYYSGYGFAIPISLAKTVMDDIVAHGHVRRAILGALIAEVTQEDAAVAKLKAIAGVKIEDFSPADNSPAKRAGLQPGDIIVAADGKDVDRVSTLQRIIRAHQPADVLELEAVRYGEHKTVRLTLAEAPSDALAEVTNVSDRRPATDASGAMTMRQLGITVEPLNADDNSSIPASVHGVLISDVQRGGAAEGKLQAGDVLVEELFPEPKMQIRTVADVQRALAKVKAGEYVGLLISRQTDAQGDRTSAVVNLRVGG